MTHRVLFRALNDSVRDFRVTLDEHGAHHLVRVCRARVGDMVVVFDGLGVECDAEITHIARGEVTLSTSLLRYGLRSDRSEVTLIQGVPKGDKLDAIVRQSTELGVRAVWPVFTLRSVPRAGGDLPGARSQRLRRIAAEASRQCGRADVPRVLDASTLEEALARLAVEHPVGPRIVAWEGAREGIPGRVKGLAPGPCVLLIGPEGGLSEQEVELCLSHGFLDVSLGPRVLRTETAPIAALALLSLLRGDLAEG